VTCRTTNICKTMLNKNGRLIVLVPSYQWLYNRFDKELGHVKRYNTSSLSEMFLRNGFKIVHKQYFNFFGILGWYVSGKLQANKTIPKNQMRFYNKIIPFSMLLDKIVFNSIGLSTIVVGEKIS